MNLHRAIFRTGGRRKSVEALEQLAGEQSRVMMASRRNSWRAVKLNWYCEHDDASTLESTYYCSRYDDDDRYTPSTGGVVHQDKFFSL